MAASDTQQAVRSVGYQRLSVAELVLALEGAGVTRVVDVRESPWSQRPEFRKKALASALQAADLDYVHRPDLGNPFRGQGLAYEQWSAQFSAHMQAHPARITGLEALVRQAPTALLCVCRRSTQCHRGLLLDALVARGLRVVELPEDRQIGLF